MFESNATLVLSAVDALPLGLAVIDLNSHLRFANEVMTGIFERRGVFAVREGRLCLTHEESDEALQSILARFTLAAESKRALRPSRFVASTHTGKRDISVFLRLIGVPNRLAFPANAAVVAIAQPLNRHDMLDSGRVGEFFGLTESEAQLTIALIKHGSLGKAATIRRLTEGSARQYMKRIFHKTHTNSQVELVALVLGYEPFQLG